MHSSAAFITIIIIQSNGVKYIREQFQSITPCFFSLLFFGAEGFHLHMSFPLIFK